MSNTYNGTYITVTPAMTKTIQNNITINTLNTGYASTSTTGTWNYIINSPDVFNITVDGKEHHFARSEVEKMLIKHVQLKKLIDEQPAVAEAWKKLEAMMKLCHYDESGE